MLISAEMVPLTPQEPIAPPVFSEPPFRHRVLFRSNLHDFDFPILKTWGKQQVLHCLNVNRKGEIITSNRRPKLIGPSANFPKQIRQDDNRVTISNDADSEGAKAKLLPQLHKTTAPSCSIYEPEPNHQPERLRAPFPCAPTAPQLFPIPSSNSPSDVVQTYNLRIRRVHIRKKDNQVTISNNAASEATKAKLLAQLGKTAAPSCKRNESEPNHQPEVLRAPFPCALAATPLPVSIPSSNSPSDVAQTCNLKSRRVPIHKKLSSNASLPPPALEKNAQRRTVRIRSDKLAKRDYWPKILIPLSRKEIEEDFIAMTASRPPRRPNKRPRLIQRQLDQLCPGLLLPSISRATYDIFLINLTALNNQSPLITSQGSSSKLQVRTQLSFRTKKSSMCSNESSIPLQ